MFKKNSLVFQSCDAEYEESSVVIFSAPMDATCSFRPGARFAGNSIRVDSIGVEWYSPYLDKNLKDYKTCDIGDLDLPVGDVEKSLEVIKKTTEQIIKDSKKVAMIGGEHLVTLGVVSALVSKYSDLYVIHFDAHTDLRDTFLGRKLSHATVIRRVIELVGNNKVFQFGIRSGDSFEFEYSKNHSFMQKFNLDGLSEVVEFLKDKNVYITIDLDVLDPSVFPGTGTPEPGGITYKELLDGIKLFSNLNNIVGFDIVELSPLLDSSGVSTMVACKTLRELILTIQK